MNMGEIFKTNDNLLLLFFVSDLIINLIYEEIMGHPMKLMENPGKHLQYERIHAK